MKLIPTFVLFAFAPSMSHSAAPGATECTLRCDYNGKEYLKDESFPSVDGCNMCSCAENGSVACTKKMCACTDCMYGGFSYCDGDRFPSIDGCNECSCSAKGSVACTEKYCLPLCTQNSDCFTTTRGCAIDRDKLCTCEARAFDEIYDECEGEDGETEFCVCAECASDPCVCYDAVCDHDAGRCVLSLKPIDDESATTKTLKPFSANKCKGNILKPGDTLEKGEAICRKSAKGFFQFGLIGDGSDLDGTLHLLKVTRGEVEDIVWSLYGTSEDTFIKGDSLHMHVNGNLALYRQEFASCSSDSECGKGLTCYTGISKDCDEDCGDINCAGECRKVTKDFCGGFAGFECPEGSNCVDNKGDNCSPNCSGADCGGICLSAKHDSAKKVWQTGCKFNRGARLVMARVRSGAKRARIVVKATRRLNFGKKWWLRENGKESNKC